MKACPQCGADNRLGARFCIKCGHTFTSGVPAVTSRRWLVLSVGAAGVVLITLLVAGVMLRGTGRDGRATLIAPVVSGRATATRVALVPTAVGRTTATMVVATPTVVAGASRRRAMQATVLLIVPMDAQPGRNSAGSASVITAKGHLLTNFHVIGDPDTGQLYNREGMIWVAVSAEPDRQPPEVTYRAELAASDVRLDLALLRIVARQDGRPLGRDLGLTTMPVGDSDTVHTGDDLFIIGFPGLGGDTITLTRGTVSGFLLDEGWIKTDAEINPGNSGGAAVNEAGELVGIPSAARSEVQRLPGKIGLVRPVNLAKPLIERAKQEAGEGN
jgi:S1-C subfamily serine protease